MQFRGDEKLRQGTLRILSLSGGLAGTGFCITGDGVLLTCQHVVAGRAAVEVRDFEGRRWRAFPVPGDDPMAHLDLAFLQVEPENGHEYPLPLPLLVRQAEEMNVRSRGCLSDDASFAEAIPLEGRLRGATRIRYRGRTSQPVTAHPLQGFIVEAGMSGAPLWNDELDAVIGVLAVSAHGQSNLSGFAILLPQSGASPAFDEFLGRNARSVTRSGAQPNDLGLRTALLRASTTTLETLIDRQIVLPAKFVQREGAHEAVRAFLDSSATAFPIISPAAHGKTSLLADLAFDPSLPPVWLVRGVEIGNAAPEAALDSLLRQVRELPANASFATLAACCHTPPVLCLDALNEVRVEAVAMANEWLPALQALVCRAGWKLIFTTRPELFSFMASSWPRFFKPPAGQNADREGRFFVLGTYTATESKAALTKYRVKRHLSRNIGRHPLMVRLADDAGDDADRRTRVLRKFLDRLVTGTRHATRLHPDEILRRLIGLAVLTEAHEGLFPIADAQTSEIVGLIPTLLGDNLLEEVVGGYRFIFDEVRDYLLSCAVAEGVRGPTGLRGIDTAQYSPAVIAAAIEILDDSGHGALAVEWASQIALSVVHPVERERSFSTMVNLPRTSAFDPIKDVHIGALIRHMDPSDHLLDRVPDLGGALPSRSFDALLLWSIQQEQGYGWREKDVWSNMHRGSTIAFGRMQIGAPKLVQELLDDDERDGAAFLFDLLDNPSELRDSHEASVGSFALCMILTHREQIGVGRIFDEIVLKDRRGADSLADALSEEEPLALAAILRELPRQSVLDHFPIVRGCWRRLLHAEASDSHPELKDQAATFFDSIVDELPLDQVKATVKLAGATQLPLRLDIPAAIERLRDRNEIDSDVLIAGLALRKISLSEAVLISEAENQAGSFILALLHSNRETLGVSLREVVSLARAHRPKLPGIEQLASAVEMVCYRVGGEEAREACLDGLIEEMLRQDFETVARFLAYPAAARWEADAQQTQFRDWLLDRLTVRPLSPGRAFRLLKVLIGSGGDLAANIDTAIELAAALPAKDLVVLFAMSSAPLDEAAGAIISSAVKTGGRPAKDMKRLKAALNVLTDPALTSHQRRMALHGSIHDAGRASLSCAPR